jgi:hypothetical protein
MDWIPPPVVADRKTRKITDGFHRLRAALRHFGETAEVAVIWEDYANEAAMFERSAELNGGHGLKFTPWDRVRVIVRCEELGVAADRIAELLRMPVAAVEDIRNNRVAMDTDGRPLPIKAALSHMAGKQFTPKQQEALAHVGGNQHRFYINQLILAAESKMLDLDNPNLIAGLVKLVGVLRPLLSQPKAKTG